MNETTNYLKEVLEWETKARDEIIASRAESRQLRSALVWCLENGVGAVDFCTTGYWHHNGGEGGEIMPPADFHIVLDLSRQQALKKLTG